MMGLFDGLSGGSDHGSSAEIAKMLHLPVVLVMDTSASARSIAATLLGFATFDPQVKVAAVILNRVGGEGHFQMLAEAIEGSTAIPILGWIPENRAWAIPERHLGLHDANERAWKDSELASLAEVAEKNLDLDKLLELATADNEAAASHSESTAPQAPTVRIGVARDEAFSFYYEDNFDLLKDYGAELIDFSPLHHRRLPENLDALYIGGGYPELHANGLRENSTMIADVQQFCRSGRPVYAECGGMMFLSQSIAVDGAPYAMAGVLPLSIEMSPRLVKFGYVRVRFTRDCILGPAGMETTGHSFHYSKIHAAENVEMAYSLQYLGARMVEPEGYSNGNVLASYIHLHFRSNHQLAKHFVDAAFSRKLTRDRIQ